MIDDDPRTSQAPREPSEWALTTVAFAACGLTLLGAFEVIAGWTAVADDSFYVVTRDYTFDLDTTAWGWIHLVLGAGLLITGLGLFGRRTWAGVTALVLGMIAAIVNFLFIPYYPFWSIVLLAMNVWVIWALTRPGAVRT